MDPFAGEKKYKSRVLKIEKKNQMKLIINLILACLIITFTKTWDLQSIIDRGESIQTANFLNEWLDLLQQKLNDNTFKNKDIKSLGLLVDFFFKMKEKIRKRRMKERPIFGIRGKVERKKKLLQKKISQTYLIPYSSLLKFNSFREIKDY